MFPNKEELDTCSGAGIVVIFSVPRGAKTPLSGGNGHFLSVSSSPAWPRGK